MEENNESGRIPGRRRRLRAGEADSACIPLRCHHSGTTGNTGNTGNPQGNQQIPEEKARFWKLLVGGELWKSSSEAPPPPLMCIVTATESGRSKSCREEGMREHLPITWLLSSPALSYGRISPSIRLCQPLSFSCISSTIFHYSLFSPSFLAASLALAALIEAAAARRARRYLIRRLNRRRGPMANPSANKKEGAPITSAGLNPPEQPNADVIFNSGVFYRQTDPHQTKFPSVIGSTVASIRAPAGRRAC